MVNAKDKGSRFEGDAVKILNEKIDGGTFKRIAGSGAIGTSMSEPLLTGDITGKIEGFRKPFKIECKVGYGGEKQFALKREWLNKIKMEAAQTYAFPMLIGKFSGARKADGVQTFIVMDVDEFAYLVNHITHLKKELDSTYEELQKLKADGR